MYVVYIHIHTGSSNTTPVKSGTKVNYSNGLKTGKTNDDGHGKLVHYIISIKCSIL